MTGRAFLKWLHWTTFFLLLWFVSIPQSDLRPGLIGANRMMGALLCAVALLWFARYLIAGTSARPGPKMDGTARRVQWLSHHALHLALPILAYSGAVVVMPALPLADLQPMIVMSFLAAVSLHGLFNLWRHTVLRDNALAIMVPRALHFLL